VQALLSPHHVLSGFSNGHVPGERTVTANDVAENTATATATCTVPHDINERDCSKTSEFWYRLEDWLKLSGIRPASLRDRWRTFGTLNWLTSRARRHGRPSPHRTLLRCPAQGAIVRGCHFSHNAVFRPQSPIVRCWILFG
jgi:hypothetical protein